MSSLPTNMNARGLRGTLIRLAPLILIPAVGCQSDRDSAGPTAAVSGLDGPEKSFEKIVEAFRGQVEDVAPFVQSGDGKFTSFTARREVSHKLMPPTDPDENYRGQITVKTYSRFSYRPVPDSAEEQRDADTTDDSTQSGNLFGPDDDLIGGFNTGIDDESSTGSGEGFPQGLMQQRENEYERVYELAFENDRWVLTSELDPEAEESIQMAFDHVLSRQ